MVHNHSVTHRHAHFSLAVWILRLALIIALTTIFIFNIPLSSLGYYSLLAFFIGGHFLMLGSSDGQAAPEQRPGAATTPRQAGLPPITKGPSRRRTSTVSGQRSTLARAGKVRQSLAQEKKGYG